MASKTEAGPDFVIQATNFTTTLPDGAVCIRKVDADADNYPPVSVPTFLRKAAELGGEHTALAVKRENGEAWTKWTYRQYLDEVEIAARAFIKLGEWINEAFDRSRFFTTKLYWLCNMSTLRIICQCMLPEPVASKL